jgi:hypothetical protein
MSRSRLVAVGFVVGAVVRAAYVAEPSAFATALLVLRVLIAVADDATSLRWSAVLLGIFHEWYPVAGGPIAQLVDGGIEGLAIALIILVGIRKHGNGGGVDHASPTVANDGRECIDAVAGTGNAGKVCTLGT